MSVSYVLYLGDLFVDLSKISIQNCGKRFTFLIYSEDIFVINGYYEFLVILLI